MFGVFVLVGFTFLVLVGLVFLALREQQVTTVFAIAGDVLEDARCTVLDARGRWKGREMHITLVGATSGAVETLLRVETVAPCVGLLVTESNARQSDEVSRLLTQIGSLSVGPLAFRRRFRASGSGVAWLTPEVIEVAMSSPKEVVIQDGKVAIEFEAIKTSAAELRAMLAAVSRLARAVERAALPLSEQAIDPDGPPVHRAAALLSLLRDHPSEALGAARLIRQAPIADPLLDAVTLRALAQPHHVDPSIRAQALAALEGLPEVAIHAVAALAVVGHVDDVAPLRARAASGGSLAQAIQEAVVAIQARSGGEAGEVSLAHVGGDLALAARPGRATEV
jgi:hypothetical protein